MDMAAYELSVENGNHKWLTHRAVSVDRTHTPCSELTCRHLMRPIIRLRRSSLARQLSVLLLLRSVADNYDVHGVAHVNSKTVIRAGHDSSGGNT
jgi:hypothetical protein